ncbi:DNA-packaging protein [Algicella marina]|uniref:ATP-binding protein n=1 Tax=Algicella marina TaxID=2683284 RepID=A0A6P1T6H8_9RHOB|nr:terminase family protein [Algicella marina]QHQ37290.1 ATP-binding protein [Algicella marina]
MPPEVKYVSDLLGSASAAEVDAFLEGLSDNAIAALPYLFEHWAHTGHQLAPEGDWDTWVILGGRGAGKTRAGAEWVRMQVEGPGPLDAGRCRRVALIGETYDQARDVMVMGDSGVLACVPPDRRPKWEAARRRLVWPNGAEAVCFSASDPEALRGPQFDCAWADELGKWTKAEDAWDMLQFCLRLGDDPRQVITTTPRDTPLLRRVLEAPRTVRTSAPTSANEAHLARGFVEKVTARYAGTRLGRQELDGEMLEGAEGALWSRVALDDLRCEVAPVQDRLVVAVDPPVTTGKSSDECGIIVVSVKWDGPPQAWKATVLEDGSLQGASPQEWAAQAVRLLHKWKADRLVAEVNQGGELVESLLRQIDPLVPYRAVRASRGKIARAEPVAALYEQGRVAHMPGLAALEDQMVLMTSRGYEGSGSPDRVDALVWALTDLVIEPAAAWNAPRVRGL